MSEDTDLVVVVSGDRAADAETLNKTTRTSIYLNGNHSQLRASEATLCQGLLV